MAPAMNKLWSTLRSRLAPNEQPDKSSGGREPPSARPTATATATAQSQRDSPHELPELHFSPPLEAPELPRTADPATQEKQRREEEAPPSSTTGRRDPQALPPPLPQIETLRVTDYATSVTPPTPVEASSSSHPDSTFSASRPSTPPSSEPSLQPSGPATTGSPLQASSSPNLTPHDLRGANALAHRERRHHRRSSSTGSRSFRETLNAYSTEDADGRRSVNQYILGETLGRGSYATVEKAVDRETGEEYVSPAQGATVVLVSCR